MKVLLEGPVLTQSGYGEHARLVFKSIKDHDGIDIYVNPLNWGNTPWTNCTDPEMREQVLESVNKLRKYAELSSKLGKKTEFDVQIHVGIPSEFEKKATHSICVTAGIETDRVAPEWLIRSHKGMNKIIVPSNHAKLGFIKTSYEMVNNANGQKTIVNCACPVDVVPYPVKQVEPSGLDFKTDTDFNFLFVSLMGPRKNLDNTISAFIEEFRDENVGLIVKTGLAKGTPMDREACSRHINNIVSRYDDKKCKVYLLHGDLDEAEIHSLYCRDDVYALVSATHGEGYGLPIFEAAYRGLPVIATDWSAHVEFLSAPYKEGGKVKNKKLFAKIEYDLKPIPESAVWKDILVEGSQWAYPKEQSIKKQMRNVHKNHGMYKKWAAALQKHILEEYKEEAIMKMMREAILSKEPLEVQDNKNEMDIVVI
jgi:glycosyltransferase involved in cell wall biosynthesis